jgi:hypothetical protein
MDEILADDKLIIGFRDGHTEEVHGYSQKEGGDINILDA